MHTDTFDLTLSTEAKTTTKREVNLMSLLSTFDDIIDAAPEAEEKEGKPATAETPKLPRTNSLEDLGIKEVNGRKSLFVY